MRGKKTLSIADDLRECIQGDVFDSGEPIEEYSRDWSLFKVVPEVVVFPKSTEEISKIVRYVDTNKKKSPNLSITGRSGGTDMSGGSLNESIILGCDKYLNHFSIDYENLNVTVEPGVYYRDFEQVAGKDNISLPSFPASKDIAGWGGMIMNNGAGERTLRYGQIRNFVDSVKMVLADGNEYEFSKLSRPELDGKKKQDNLEGEVYRKMSTLVLDNHELIQKAKPRVSKNASGYALWDIWDKQTDEFDLSQLFVGSQGTLGILTEARVRLMKDKPYRRMVPIFFKNWKRMPQVVNELLKYDLESLETFDDETMILGIRFLPQIAKLAGENMFSFMWKFWPEAFIGLRMFGMPKLIILAEIAEDTSKAADEKAEKVRKALKKFWVWTRRPLNEKESEKYWAMRRNSFKILTENADKKRTVPLVDDFCVDPKIMPEFLPKVLKVLKDAGIKANISGHAGDGNFHIIPLMNLKKEKNRAKLPEVADKIYDLIIEHGGTITAEHNDGILRTPYVEKMYGKEMMKLFEEVKRIFDPKNIFNPGKKVPGDRNVRTYLEEHIAPENKPKVNAES